MKNNIPLFTVIMVILVILRCLFNNNPQLVVIIAGINLTALLIVLFSITAQLKKRGTEKITRIGAVNHFVKRDNKHFRRAIDCGVYIPYAFISSIYLLYFKCELGNDIISIVALCLSLSNEYIVTTIIDLL